jgi:ABC-type antimicrobial peptide transport system permease subunit
MALGADRGRVLSLILGQAGRLAAVGLALGIPSAWGAALLVRSQLFGTDAADPWTWLGATGLLGLISLLASYLPARRAARSDPARVLRGH